MPSTRRTSRTASGAKRPLRNAKTDSGLKNSSIRTGRSFNLGYGTTGSVSHDDKGNVDVYYDSRLNKNKRYNGTYRTVYSRADQKRDSKSINPGSRAMSSYAKNYFKKNSK